MCAHNMKDSGMNKSSKSFWNSFILNTEPIKLQCIDSVEPKDANELSQIKFKL